MKLETGVTYVLKYIELDYEMVFLHLHQYETENIEETKEFYERNVEKVLSDKRLYIKKNSRFVPFDNPLENLTENILDNTQFYRRVFIEIEHA